MKDSVIKLESYALYRYKQHIFLKFYNVYTSLHKIHINYV